PLLVLAPLYLRLERDHPWRKRLMLTIAFLLLMEAATLSRSGLLGLILGALILALPYQRYLLSRQLLVPVGGALAVMLAIVLSRRHFFSVLLSTRVATGGKSESAHFSIYG